MPNSARGRIENVEKKKEKEKIFEKHLPVECAENITFVAPSLSARAAAWETQTTKLFTSNFRSCI